MFRFRGTPVRVINGLPYSVHQMSNEQWQIVIQNCERHPAGYSFAPTYGSYEEALEALNSWSVDTNNESLAGDDTGAAELAYFED